MTRLANLAAHRAAATAPNVVAFPLTERALESRLAHIDDRIAAARIELNRQRLDAARAVLRTAGHHDTLTLCRAILDLRELGTPTDIEIADICETTMVEDAIRATTIARDYRQIHALDRVIVAPPPEKVVASRGLQRLTIAIVAVTVAAIALAIAHDAPARTAATVLQAQAEGW